MFWATSIKLTGEELITSISSGGTRFRHNNRESCPILSDTPLVVMARSLLMGFKRDPGWPNRMRIVDVEEGD
jgi:hypothetical protein